MQNEYADRQNMHLTVLKLIDTPEFEAAWKDQKPTAFTTRAAQLRPLVNSLTDLVSGQQAATTGYSETKDREEQELEALAHEIGQTLADWYEENGREGDSAQIDLSLTAWQRLRDTELIAKARLLHKKLIAALASDAAALADYDLTPADATLLAKETDDFEQITADPSAAISRRRALTVTLRPKFAQVGQLLKKMDRLVLRFRRTEPGAAFAGAWSGTDAVAVATPNATVPVIDCIPCFMDWFPSWMNSCDRSHRHAITPCKGPIPGGNPREIQSPSGAPAAEQTE